MTLDGMVKMAKADQYTDEGKQAIQDARRTYKTGEISQATGLQKQPDGSWAPPKGAKNTAKTAGSSAGKPETSSGPAKEKTFTFTKAGHVYNVPASSPAEAVQKLKARGVKGFKESDAFDDSTPRSRAGSSAGKDPAEGWATKAFSSDQQKKMQKLGFKPEGDNWVAEKNGHKYELKVSQQNNPYMASPATSATLYIDGDKRPYSFGGGEKIDPNSMIKIEKALKEQGYENASASSEAKPAKKDTMEEMRNTDRPLSTMENQIDAGSYDDAIIESEGDSAAIMDIARDILSPAFDAVPDQEIPESWLKAARDSVRKRYTALRKDAMGDSAPLTGDTKIRVRK